MSTDPDLRDLDVNLPASPGALLRLGELLAREDSSVAELAEVVETDMALAAGVMRTVNSAMFGLLRRVETVAEAVQFLGQREVAAITFEMGLRSRFPADPLLDDLWAAARRRGLLMGRMAARLGLHAWRAQSAGLFAQTGQAVLLLRDCASFAFVEAGWTPKTTPRQQAEDEAQRFGIHHAQLGAALCRAWGLASDVAACVRERPYEDRWHSHAEPVRALLVLGALADTDQAEAAAASAERLAPLASLTPAALLAAWTKEHARLSRE